jgi:hypothetical protein
MVTTKCAHNQPSPKVHFEGVEKHKKRGAGGLNCVLEIKTFSPTLKRLQRIQAQRDK